MSKLTFKKLRIVKIYPSFKIGFDRYFNGGYPYWSLKVGFWAIRGDIHITLKKGKGE